MGKRPATHADLEALPPHVVGEILAGELYASPRPAIPHTWAASRLGVLLGVFDLGAKGPGGWTLLDEPELHLGPDVLVPDLAGWHCERLPAPPRSAALTLAPDWVCELLSPSTEARDRVVKLPLYAREGVEFVWLVDPDVRTLELLHLTGTHYTRLTSYAQEATVRAEPFATREFSLGLLWGG